MNFLQGLHGAVAIALLCSLLFAEEAGVPLPFAPGEVTLLAAGLLLAAGGLNPFVFVPLALLACLVGALVGYTWARAVGDHGLRSLARRLHQERSLDRVSDRIRSAGWLGVGVSRLIPGLRIYTTLVAGAVRVPRRTFVAGLVPATVLWVAVYVTLGALVGVPIEHFLSSVQKLAVQGAILVAMGVGCYLAIRKTPASAGAGLVRVPGWFRILLAAAIDIGVVSSIITGLLALGRLLGVGVRAGWVDGVVALLVVAAFYVVIARRSGGATVGESLLHTSYATGQGLPLRPALRATRKLLAEGHGDLPAAAELFRALGDPERLELVGRLLEKPRTVAELTAVTQRSPFELRHQLGRLADAGLLVMDGDEHFPIYRVRPDLEQPLIELLDELPASRAAGNGALNDLAVQPGGGAAGEPVTGLSTH